MDLKILSIGSDRNLFVPGSEAQKRIRDYGAIFSELHIVVFADKDLGYSDLELAENVFVYPTNHRFKFLYLWNIYEIVKSLSKVEGQWSVVSSQDPFEAGLAGWMIKLLFRLPLQIQVHTDVFSPFFAAESLANRIRVFAAKFLLPRADGIRVVSERIKNSLSTFDFRLSTKITVLPVFVDVRKIQAAKVKMNLHEKYPDHDFIFLMASRLTPEKNIGLAIEAMKTVAEKYPKSLLLIVGDGPGRNALQQLIGKIPSLNVIIESWTDNLVSYYKTADAFLLTSNYEGYGRTVVEAMAAGLPVIMTDVGIANEILIDDLDGMVVPVGDAGSLADAMMNLRTDGEKTAGFIRNSNAAIASFPSKEEYLAMYRNSFNL